MMRLRRASAIAVPFLLASAATAHAEWYCGRRQLMRPKPPASRTERETHRTSPGHVQRSSPRSRLVRPPLRRCGMHGSGLTNRWRI
jgi:hypothetical protein